MKMSNSSVLRLALAAGAACASFAAAQPAFEYNVDVIEQPANGFALYPNAINNQGVVVGWWYGSPVTNRHPFIYSQAAGYAQLPKPAGFEHSEAIDINDGGVIVGMAMPTWSSETTPRGWKLENGQFSMYTAYSRAVGINNSGLIVGKSCIDASLGNFSCFFTSTQPPAMDTFPGAGGYGASMWNHIFVNNLGEMAYTTAGNAAVFKDAQGVVHPLPPPPSGWTGIRVDGVNDQGQVIARWTRSVTSSSSIRRYSRGFLWSVETGAQLFDRPEGSVRPKGINNLGQILLETGGHDQQYFDTWVWTAETGSRNLEPIIDPAMQIIMTDLYAINDNGQIVAGGISQAPPAGNVYVVLNPVTPPAPTCDSVDFNGDGLFPDNQDLEDFLSVFGGGPCSTGTCGDVDFNNDGLFPDNADMEAFFSVFGGGAC